mmetsp:Transcript_22228/g.71837  ORF Transcript_22228/g.71837 Transcript_22228/m.71837 type:complete len:206 (+) Transcript_22228:768-1385(+)
MRPSRAFTMRRPRTRTTGLIVRRMPRSLPWRLGRRSLCMAWAISSRRRSTSRRRTPPRASSMAKSRSQAPCRATCPRPLSCPLWPSLTSLAQHASRRPPPLQPTCRLSRRWHRTHRCSRARRRILPRVRQLGAQLGARPRQKGSPPREIRLQGASPQPSRTARRCLWWLGLPVRTSRASRWWSCGPCLRHVDSRRRGVRSSWCNV